MSQIIECSASSGVGIINLLGVIFIVLKLTGNIDWSWWWVLSPYLFGLAIVMIMIILAIIVNRLDQS